MTPNSERKKSNFFIEAWSTTKRAFDEFLALPAIIITFFILFAIGTNFLDRENISWINNFRSFMQHHFFNAPEATSDLLSAIAAGLITMSSLTITLLLIVVQQSSASMTTEVFDQFLRSRINQSIFGFFVGLSLFALIVLATVSENLNPVLGGTFAFILTVLALILLIILIYSTINQMRPPVIIDAVQRQILAAQHKQASLLAHTLRASVFEGKISFDIHSERHGYIIDINRKVLNNVTKEFPGEVEIIYRVSIGEFISVHDVFATVNGNNHKECEKVIKAVYAATEMDLQRKTSTDPGDGIEQIEMIAWTNVSTSKSNPYPGVLGIRALRNLLAQWKDLKPDKTREVMPVVYNDDSEKKILNTIETLAVISSESMQHQVFIEVIKAFTILYPRMDSPVQQRIEDITLRILSAMGDFVLTRPLDAALSQLAIMLRTNESNIVANTVEQAQNKLKESIGKLNSRATRTEH